MRGRRAVEVVVIARPLVQADRIDRVDAIAVLGHGSHADGTLSPETAYGLLHGVRLLERGAGRILILSGGTHRGTSTPDADAMAGVARALGIPAAAMMLDRRASSTVDHALAVAAIATGHRLGTVAVVTPPLRSRRAALAFRRAGVNALAAPGVSLDELPTALFVRRDDPLARLGFAADVLSEYLALAHYGLRGWL